MWTNAILELRTKLNDRSTDKLRANKLCFGETDGTNKLFKTLEFRRVTDFTIASSPEGVYVDGVRVASSGIAVDLTGTGFFEFVNPPTSNSRIEATYFIQWFLDYELDEFLKTASRWLGFGDNYENVDDGLIPAILSYAAAEAYQKLALKYAESLADTFMVQGAPAENVRTPVDYYRKLSEDFRKEAEERRDNFYRRQGQSLSPLYGIIKGKISKVTPNK